MVGSWVFPGKRKRKKVGVCLTVIGRGNMQIAILEILYQGKGIRIVKHERIENLYLKITVKLI